MSIDGIDRGGINLAQTGIPHNGGDTGNPDPVRARAEIRRELADLTKRIEALERTQRESQMIP